MLKRLVDVSDADILRYFTTVLGEFESIEIDRREPFDEVLVYITTKWDDGSGLPFDIKDEFILTGAYISTNFPLNQLDEKRYHQWLAAVGVKHNENPFLDIALRDAYEMASGDVAKENQVYECDDEMTGVPAWRISMHDFTAMVAGRV